MTEYASEYHGEQRVVEERDAVAQNTPAWAPAWAPDKVSLDYVMALVNCGVALLLGAWLAAMLLRRGPGYVAGAVAPG